MDLPSAFAREEAAWPEPRPLDRDLPAFKADPAKPDIRLQIKEPTGPLTLRQALSLALMKNPGLAAFSWEVRAGEARTLQAGLLPNPEFSVETENFGGGGTFRSFDRTETTLQLSQLVLLAGKRSKRKRVASLERDLAGWDYETKRLDVLTRVSMDFTDVLAAQERLALFAELLRLAERFHETVAEQVKAGKVSPVMETKADISLASTQIEWERAKRTLSSSRKRLTANWGGETPTFSKAEGDLKAIRPVPSAGQLEKMISQNPDLARWSMEMEQRQATIDLADAGRIPDLTVSGAIRHFDETKDNALLMKVSIPLPIFNRNQGKSLEARHRLSKAKKEQRASKIRVLTSLAKAYQVLSSAYMEATAWKTRVLPGAQSAFNVAREGYRYGKFSFMDVLDAQRTLFKAKEKYIGTLAAYHKAVSRMERLIGAPLKKAMEGGPHSYRQGEKQ